MFRRLITSIRQNYSSYLISAVGLGLLAVVATRPEKEVRVLSSDLAFLMRCPVESFEEIETNSEKFLSENGFRVINRGNLLRQKLRDSGSESEASSKRILSEIVGLNGDNVWIDIRALPYPEGTYAATLRTPPPTKRAVLLENELLGFVDRDLPCSTRQITRHENTADRQDLYAMELKRLEGWFRQADEFQRSRQLQ